MTIIVSQSLEQKSAADYLCSIPEITLDEWLESFTILKSKCKFEHKNSTFKGKDTCLKAITEFFAKNNTDKKYRFLSDDISFYPGLQPSILKQAGYLAGCFEGINRSISGLAEKLQTKFSEDKELNRKNEKEIEIIEPIVQKKSETAKLKGKTVKETNLKKDARKQKHDDDGFIKVKSAKSERKSKKLTIADRMKANKGTWEGPTNFQYKNKPSQLVKIHIKTSVMDVTKEIIKKDWMTQWKVTDSQMDVLQLMKNNTQQTFCAYFMTSDPNQFKQFIPQYVKWSYYKGRTRPKEYNERCQKRAYFLSKIGSDVTEDILKERVKTCFENVDHDKIEIKMFDQKHKNAYKNAYMRLTASDENSELLQKGCLLCEVDYWKRKFPPRDLQNSYKPTTAEEYKNKEVSFSTTNRNLIKSSADSWTFDNTEKKDSS